jgi:phage/conjugal plasmid C-4 type zinc finger TraR family protein
MNFSNAAFDQADRLAEGEREAGIAKARAEAARLSAVNDDGPLVCDCGEPIPEARRRAVPGTDKCFDCASLAERRRA